MVASEDLGTGIAEDAAIVNNSMESREDISQLNKLILNTNIASSSTAPTSTKYSLLQPYQQF
jgi:hypothetical protein